MKRTPLDRVPEPQDCVLPLMLARCADDTPDRAFVRFADGSGWTFAETEARAGAVAAGLAVLGVGRGDRVLMWLPNGPEALALWFGAARLGAVLVPINLALRGGTLAHAVAHCEARVMVAHGDLVPLLGTIATGALTDLVIVGDPAAAPAALRTHRFADLGGEPPPFAAIAPWDLALIIYTSGTTGPAKGVTVSYAQLYSNWDSWAPFGPDDRILVNLPMFHLGGVGPIFCALMAGASIAFAPPFRTDTFWRDVRESGASFAILLGAMANFLVKASPRPDERAHALKRIAMIPLVDDLPGFSARFGCDVFSWFSMTEVSVPILTGINPQVPGSCGRLRPGCSAMIADPHDRALPDGAVGELLLRSDRPWGFAAGYHRDDAATAAAWRNGWFHTGDAFRRDADGNYFFVDRIKDAIRRRGENISSADVEAEVLAHPQVLEAAAIGVAAEGGEQEVMIVVAPHPGEIIAPEALIAFLVPRLPHFMVPRYIRFVPELPKTPTQKVRKGALRSEGITAESWDREAAGIRLRSERIA